MTWIHCSIIDGSCIALSTDEDWNKASDTLHPEMLKNYFHVHIDKSIENLRYIIDPVLDNKDNIIHKYCGYIDINKTITEKNRLNIRNRGKIVDPIHKSINSSDIKIRK